MIEQRFLSLDQAASRLGLTSRQVHELVRAGAIPALRLGGDTYNVDSHRLDDPEVTRAVVLTRYSDPAKRLRRLKQLYANGLTLEMAGAEVGITGSRAGELLKQAGVALRSPAEARALARARARTQHLERAEEILATYKHCGSIAETAKALEVPASIVKEVVASLPRASAYRRKAPYPHRFSDQELIDMLRRAAPGNDEPLSGKAYDRYRQGRRRKGHPWPALITFIKRFGSWNEALAAAGLPRSDTVRRKGRFKYSESDCIEAIRTVADELGAVPTVHQYLAACKHDASLPSLGSIRARFGRWKDALEASEVL